MSSPWNRNEGIGGRRDACPLEQLTDWTARADETLVF